jgi:hypothetical protein
MYLSAKRAVSLWVRMIESFSSHHAAASCCS